MRTVFWENNELKMIDQRILPARFEVRSYRGHKEVAHAITDMVVRGAPAIGAAAAFGLALAGYESASTSTSGLLADLQTAAAVLESARPTAVNLAWAVDRIMTVAGKMKEERNVDQLRLLILDEAQNLRMKMSRSTNAWQSMAPRDQRRRYIIHHCNTGALATVDWGTALGVIQPRMSRAKDSRAGG